MTRLILLVLCAACVTTSTHEKALADLNKQHQDEMDKTHAELADAPISPSADWGYVKRGAFDKVTTVTNADCLGYIRTRDEH